MSIDVGRAVGYLELDTTKFKSGFSSALSDLKSFESSTATTKDKLTGLSSAMGSMGSTLTKGLTLPILGAGTAMVKTSMDFEAGMSEVQAISGATGNDLEALKDKAKEMGATTKFSASESAEALKYMAMAGWDTQKMLDGLPGVMNLAAASGEELATVSDIVTDALTAFGMKAEEAGHFADILAKASSKSNTNVSMMGETFKYVAPVAGALGFSAEDTAIAIGLMANSGIKASQAGTSLRQIMTNLGQGVELTGDAFGKFQVDTVDAQGNMLEFGEILDQLREGFADMTEAEKAANAESIAGKVGMSGLLAIVNATEEDYKKLTKEIYNAEGASKEMADLMNNNLRGQFTILGSTIEGIAIQFGDILLPAIKNIVQGFQNFATWLSSTSDSTKQIIVVIATVLAALGPMLLIGSKLITGFLTIKSLLASTGMALGAITGPIGIVIAVVAGLALAFTTNFAGMRDTVTRVMSMIASTITSVIATVKSKWDSNWMGIRTTVTTIFEAIKVVVKAALGVIEGIIQTATSLIKGDWEGAWKGIKKVFSSIWEGIKGLLKTFLKFIVDQIINLAASLYVKGKETMKRLGDGFKEIWETIKLWMKAFIDDPIGTLIKLGKKLYDKGKDVINSLWKGLKAKWEAVKGWFKGIADWVEGIWDSIKKKFDDAVATKEKAGKIDTSGNNKKSKKVEGFAKGLPYVPYDGFPAILHKGERVLTAKEAKGYNSGNNGTGTYEFNFYSPQELSPAEQARQFKKTMNELLFNM